METHPWKKVNMSSQEDLKLGTETSQSPSGALLLLYKPGQTQHFFCLNHAAVGILYLQPHKTNRAPKPHHLTLLLCLLRECHGCFLPSNVTAQRLYGTSVGA